MEKQQHQPQNENNPEDCRETIHEGDSGSTCTSRGDDPPREPPTKRPKRQLSQKQIEALAKGREKRIQMIRGDVSTKPKAAVNTEEVNASSSDDTDSNDDETSIPAPQPPKNKKQKKVRVKQEDGEGDDSGVQMDDSPQEFVNFIVDSLYNRLSAGTKPKKPKKRKRTLQRTRHVGRNTRYTQNTNPASAYIVI